MIFYHIFFWVPFTIAGMVMATTALIGDYDDMIEGSRACSNVGLARIVLAIAMFFVWWVFAIGFIVEMAREGRDD